MLIVLFGSLSFYAVERWFSLSDTVSGATRVADGDTLVISGARIRLIDIDAPELDQSCLDAYERDWPCGRQASEQLRSRADGRDVTCRWKSKDKFGRKLATCALPDGTDLNAWMVLHGWAVTSGYANVYGTQQQAAKSAKRGIWAGSFTPPREWRRQHQRGTGRSEEEAGD